MAIPALFLANGGMNECKWGKLEEEKWRRRVEGGRGIQSPMALAFLNSVRIWQILPPKNHQLNPKNNYFPFKGQKEFRAHHFQFPSSFFICHFAVHSTQTPILPPKIFQSAAQMPSSQSAFRPPSLLPPFLFLLFALLGPNNPSSSFFSPSSSALALPVSMLNWNPLTNFYPLSALFRSNNSPYSSRKQPSAAMVALVVVKEPRRNEKPTASPNEQPLLTIEEDKLPKEIAGARTALKPSNQRKFGTLKLCPPGGRSFFEAFELACPMKKRKKRHVMFGLGGRIRAEPPRMRKYNRRDDLGEEDEGVKGRIQNDHQHREEDQRRGEGEYRPANISEIMRICCVSGCEFADFFPHCGPFSMW